MSWDSPTSHFHPALLPFSMSSQRNQCRMSPGMAKPRGRESKRCARWREQTERRFQTGSPALRSLVAPSTSECRRCHSVVRPDPRFPHSPSQNSLYSKKLQLLMSKLQACNYLRITTTNLLVKGRFTERLYIP